MRMYARTLTLPSQDDGKISPKKVHFSEIDQVKLMSQESLASMATSEASEAVVCPSLPAFSPNPSVARIVTNKMVAAQEELTRALADTAVPSIVSLADCQPRQTIGLVRLDCCGPGLTPTVVSEPPDAAGDCSQAATTEGLPESSA